MTQPWNAPCHRTHCLDPLQEVTFAEVAPATNGAWAGYFEGLTSYAPTLSKALAETQRELVTFFRERGITPQFE